MPKKAETKGLFVYILQSLKRPNKNYIGLTPDISKRLKQHNSAHRGITDEHRPWEVLISIWFKDPKKARAFERYLKHGSGHSFTKRHFLGVK